MIDLGKMQKILRDCNLIGTKKTDIDVQDVELTFTKVGHLALPHAVFHQNDLICLLLGEIRWRKKTGLHTIYRYVTRIRNSEVHY